MINRVTSINSRGEALVMDLRRPDLSGFLLSSPNGFGPIDSEINTSTNPSGDGYYYTSSFTNYRTITLPILFWEENPNHYDIEALRRIAYKHFPIKGQIALVINSDTSGINNGRSGMIFGYVQKTEATIFAQSTGITVTLICPNPWFKSVPYKTDATTYTWSDFNYLYTVDAEIIDNDIARRRNNITYRASINNIGETSVGFISDIMFRESMERYDKEILIENIDTYLKLSCYRGQKLLVSSDRLVVSTILHEKEISVYPSETNTKENRFFYFENASDEWPVLSVGNNIIDISIDENVIESVKIKYPILYGGM